MYPVFDVSGSVTERPETLGSKEKIWLMPEPALGLPSMPHLFKVGRANTGENWSEKVCCEIAKALELPCANYALAVCNGVQGVLSERFLPIGAPFYPANMILSRVDSQYDGSLRFRQVRYKLNVALNVLRHLGLNAPLGHSQSHPPMTADEYFVGYLIFDALIGNTDRHHENWGIIVLKGERNNLVFYLAPTFDHASSLGREETDEQRQKRLNTNDSRATVEAYAGRARSAFYGTALSIKKTLTSKDVMETTLQTHRSATKYWSDKIANLERSVFEAIFQQVPLEFISNNAAEFALRLLCCNQKMIKEVALVS
jgi:HipA-like protein